MVRNHVRAAGWARSDIQAMLGHADIKAMQVYTRVSIRALKNIHSATHPARLTRATLKSQTRHQRRWLTYWMHSTPRRKPRAKWRNRVSDGNG